MYMDSDEIKQKLHYFLQINLSLDINWTELSILESYIVLINIFKSTPSTTSSPIVFNQHLFIHSPKNKKA